MTINPELFPELANIGLSPQQQWTSEDVGFEVVPPNEVPSRVAKLHDQGLDHQVKLIPYKSAVDELIEHASIYLNTPNTAGELADRLADKLKAAGSTTKRSILTDFLAKTVVVNDVVAIGHQFRNNELGSTKAINSRSKWLRDKRKGELMKWIGPNEHDLLQSVRTLGIIPRAVLDKLSKIRINVAGCSATTSTVNLLVRLGAANFGLWDAGMMSPAKIPLTPDTSISDSGQPKSLILKRSILGRNPYAKVDAYVGLLVNPDNVAANDPNNITYTEFVRAFYSLEGVDGLHIKADFDNFMREHFPHNIIGFLADVGVNAYGNLSKAGEGDHFGVGLTKAELNDLTKQKSTMPTLIGDLMKILGPNVPPEHTLQLLLTAHGEMNSWSQSMIASIQTSLVLAELILKDLQGRTTSYNQNTTIDELSNSFVLTTQKENILIARLARETLKK